MDNFHQKIFQRTIMKFKRNSFFSICLFLCISANAVDGVKSPTHCKPDEKVIFSCPFKNGKTVSLCASPDLSKNAGTLQYRFGRIGKALELNYPQPVGHPSTYFWLDSSHGGQWAQYDLSFSMGRFRYALLVQTNSALPEDGASLSVFRDPDRVADMECRFDNSINNMWLLEELGIRPRP